MATIERDIVLHGKTASGETTIDLPVTALKNVEDTADEKAAPTETDYVPVMDSDDKGRMKKTPVKALLDLVRAVYDPEGLGLPLLPKNGDGTQVTAVFTPAQQDGDICSGESLGVLFGKIARQLAALAGTMEGKAAAAHTHTKDEVGLGNVDNTADSAKSVHYAETAGVAVDQTARTTADAAMPRTGGTFTGNVAAYGTNRAGSVLRNCVVVDSAGNEVSTNFLRFVRK